MTHPTLTPESIADTLAALARIKAGDGGAPELPVTAYRILRRFLEGHIVDAELLADALAHLLDVCMGVMGWAERNYKALVSLEVCMSPHSIAGDFGWTWTISDGPFLLAEGREPTHRSAAIEVVCAIADVVGEKEGATDE